MAEKLDEIKTEKQKPADLSVGRQVGRVSYGAEWLPILGSPFQTNMLQQLALG